MELKELRIGNYVEHNDQWNYRSEKGVIQWNESDWYALGECTLFLENIKPIPLTEEWLLKFGFVKEHRYFLLENSAFLFGVTLENVVCPFFDTSMSMLVSLKYVHQLQNLYFIFMNKELEIKTI